LASSSVIDVEVVEGQYHHHPSYAPPHFMMAAPQLNPAPKPAQAITSPFFTLPDLTASSSARGMEAAEVLPYSDKLVRICNKNQQKG